MVIHSPPLPLSPAFERCMLHVVRILVEAWALAGEGSWTAGGSREPSGARSDGDLWEQVDADGEWMWRPEGGKS